MTSPPAWMTPSAPPTPTANRVRQLALTGAPGPAAPSGRLRVKAAAPPRSGSAWNGARARRLHHPGRERRWLGPGPTPRPSVGGPTWTRIASIPWPPPSRRTAARSSAASSPRPPSPCSGASIPRPRSTSPADRPGAPCKKACDCCDTGCKKRQGQKKGRCAPCPNGRLFCGDTCCLRYEFVQNCVDGRLVCAGCQPGHQGCGYTGCPPDLCVGGACICADGGKPCGGFASGVQCSAVPPQAVIGAGAPPHCELSARHISAWQPRVRPQASPAAQHWTPLAKPPHGFPPSAQMHAPPTHRSGGQQVSPHPWWPGWQPAQTPRPSTQFWTNSYRRQQVSPQNNRPSGQGAHRPFFCPCLFLQPVSQQSLAFLHGAPGGPQVTSIAAAGWMRPSRATVAAATRPRTSARRSAATAAARESKRSASTSVLPRLVVGSALGPASAVPGRGGVVASSGTGPRRPRTGRGRSLHRSRRRCRGLAPRSAQTSPGSQSASEAHSGSSGQGVRSSNGMQAKPPGSASTQKQGIVGVPPQTVSGVPGGPHGVISNRHVSAWQPRVRPQVSPARQHWMPVAAPAHNSLPSGQTHAPSSHSSGGRQDSPHGRAPTGQPRQTPRPSAHRSPTRSAGSRYRHRTCGRWSRARTGPSSALASLAAGGAAVARLRHGAPGAPQVTSAAATRARPSRAATAAVPRLRTSTRRFARRRRSGHRSGPRPRRSSVVDSRPARRRSIRPARRAPGRSVRSTRSDVSIAPIIAHGGLHGGAPAGCLGKTRFVAMQFTDRAPAGRARRADRRRGG